MSTPSVFISYSHHDQAWVDRLVRHLRVLEHEGALKVWVDDHRVNAGESWRKEIERAIETASVVVLVLSADFLSSEFIVKEEIPHLLEKRSRGEAILMPIIFRPCSWQDVSWLRPLQVWPKNSVPLSEQDRVDETLATIVGEIRSNLEAVASSRKRARRTELVNSLSRVESPGNLSRQKIFISRCEEDGDFGDLLKARLEAEGFSARVDEDCLGGGMDWRVGLDQAILESSALIVVMTPEARKSEYVTFEWAFALGAGIPVIPVMLKPTQFHPRLETLQFLDFTNRRARPWSELIEALRRGRNPGSMRSRDKNA